MNPFKYARMCKKYTQKELALILGVSRSHIAMIETDKAIPNGKLLLQLMYILSIEPNILLVHYNKIGVN